MTQEIEVISEEKKRKRAASLPVIVTPMSLIQQAQAQGAGIDQMQQLLDLQIRWEENEAKKAYFKAVAAFKSESIDILKKKRVFYKTDKGTTDYKHAELGQIVNTVTPLLSKYGLSSHWEYSQPDGKVRVTCYLTHEMGYEKSTSLEAPPDTSGGKNGIQAIGSSTSYLERYTFLAMTGLASRDQDDDGVAAEKKAPTVELITESQVMDILGLMKEVNSDEEKFCVYFKIDDVANLPKDKFDRAIKMLEAKRG